MSTTVERNKTDIEPPFVDGVYLLRRGHAQLDPELTSLFDHQNPRNLLQFLDLIENETRIDITSKFLMADAIQLTTSEVDTHSGRKRPSIRLYLNGEFRPEYTAEHIVGEVRSNQDGEIVGEFHSRGSLEGDGGTVAYRVREFDIVNDNGRYVMARELF